VRPGPFTHDKEALRRGIEALRPEGQTALYDATLDAVETLIADRSPGRRAVVVLTDGSDTSSRRSPGDIVRRAKQAGIPVTMLGLGPKGELNEEVMTQLARATGGEYYHAENPQRLYEIFENLSIQLHDDGIDEDALRRLAAATGGRYLLARNVGDLSLRYQELAEDLQTVYTVTFPSRRPSHDGTSRGIDIKIVRDGVLVSDIGRGRYQVHGVVVPDLHPGVYLALLAVLGGLLAAPAGLRRLQLGATEGTEDTEK
jgi:hypothetical protein